MSDGTNPETGVTDMQSAVKWLTTPEEGATEATETEAAQEPHEAEGEEPETEQAEGEESEAETDDSVESDADSEDGEAETEDDDPRYTVKVDGEEFEVNLTELIEGYQKGADYTRKTSAVAEERKALQAEKQQTEQMRNQLAAELERVAALGKEDEPDWAKLAQELDPWDYQQRRAKWETDQRQKYEAARQAQAMRMQQHQQAITDHAQKLLDKVPEWRDEKVRGREMQELLSVARSYGYTDQEFWSAVDHRPFLILRDAARARKLAEAEKKPPVAKRVPKKAPKSLKSGAKTTPSESRARERDALRDNLRKRGTIDDAVKYLLGG